MEIEPTPQSEHASSLRNQLRLMLWLLGPPTVISLLLIPVLDLFAWLLFGGCLAAWVVFGVYSMMHAKVLDPASEAIGRILLPTGNSTPSAKGLSHIETMVIRGKYAEAAAAYRHEIETDPEDVQSCENLGQLAMRELKDYPTAVFAYKEAEKRELTPGKKLFYGMVVAELYRDHLRQPQRAVVELSRLLSQYPDAANAGALRLELDQLKEILFEKPQ